MTTGSRPSDLPGAAGRLGHQRVKSAAADGTTLLVTPAALMTLYPHVYAKLGCAPLKDFEPVTSLATVAFTDAVSTSVVPASVRTLDDLVAWFKANPRARELRVGRRRHADALRRRDAGILPHVDGGRARVLAVTSARRSSHLPDVATLAESGARDIVASDWFGVFAPAGTPAAALDRLDEQLRAAIATPGVRAALAKLALEPAGASRTDFVRLVETDTARWAPVVQATGFRIDE